MFPLLAPLLALGSKLLPFITGIDPTKILSGVLSALTALRYNIIHHWRIWLISLLVVLQVGTGYGFYHEHTRYIEEVAAHKADNAKFVAAQAAANLAEQNEKKQLQTESKAASHEADTNYSALLTRYNASLVRYATSKGGSIGTGNYKLPTAQGIDGPSADTVIPRQITISGSDAEICAVNTARLQASHDWAIQQLQAEKDQPK